MKYKKITGILMIFLLLPIVSSQVITIGVSPSEIILSNEGKICIDFSFFNSRGEVDAQYSLSYDSCLLALLKSPYPDTFTVPKGTRLGDNPVEKTICLEGNFDTTQKCYMYVYAKPVGAQDQEGVISIERRIAVKFLMGGYEEVYEAPTTTTVTATSTYPSEDQSQSSSSSSSETSKPKASAPASGLLERIKQKLYHPDEEIPSPLISQNEEPIVETQGLEEKTESAGIPKAIKFGIPIFIVLATIGTYLFAKNKFLIPMVLLAFALSMPMVAPAVINVTVTVEPPPPLPPYLMLASGMIFMIMIFGTVAFTGRIVVFELTERPYMRYLIVGMVIILTGVAVLWMYTNFYRFPSWIP